ncbi:MAG TPA: hypothetical protein VK145_00410 [Candidatus Nanoarchaeia archaeon]|nr:hypothetical protein [Candidatus Nanoarchaeia archaeon]
MTLRTLLATAPAFNHCGLAVVERYVASTVTRFPFFTVDGRGLGGPFLGHKDLLFSNGTFLISFCKI